MKNPFSGLQGKKLVFGDTSCNMANSRILAGDSGVQGYGNMALWTGRI